MPLESEPADPIAKGIIPTLKQSWHDLFIWKYRVVTTNETTGEQRTEWQSPKTPPNPFTLFAALSLRDWAFFTVGFAAWTVDAFDFHMLSIQTVKIAKYFHTTNTNITGAITLTLLLRSIGAAGFGLLGDRFGRKWPMVVNLFILGVLQIGSIYSRNWHEFLAVRSLFGLFMGGVYGNAMAMALENCPVQSRGIISGILQQGYSVGFILVACINLRVGGASESWKKIFWIGAGLSFGVGFLRCLFPESRQFLEARKSGHANVAPGAFIRETKRMLMKEWKMCVYCSILMSWMTYLGHTTQDSYTTFMLVEKEVS